MTSDIQLDAHEARVLGVLIEKELTTPEQYPLTLNSLTLGANQKSNRDPVLELAESQVYAAIQKLVRKGLIGSVHPLGARVEKFRHNAEAVLKVGRPEVAVLAELLLRGAQQPGELRGRASRMVEIATLEDLMRVLGPLMQAGLVLRLAPMPGSRAERYAQLLASESVTGVPRASSEAQPAASIATSTMTSAAPRSPSPSVSAPAVHYSAPVAPAAPRPDPRVDEHGKRIQELEANVSKLRRQLDHLAWRLGEKLES